MRHKSWRLAIRTRNNYKYRRRKSMGDTQAAALESHLYWQRRRQTILKSLENMESIGGLQMRADTLQPGCSCTTATSHSSNSSSSASCSTCPPLLQHPTLISSPSLPCTCTSLREHCPPCRSRRHVPNCRPRPIVAQHQASCVRHQVCKVQNGLSATLPRNTVFHSKSVKFVGLPPSSPTASSPVSTQSFVSSRKALAPQICLSLTLPLSNQTMNSLRELTLVAGSSTGDSQILVSQFDPALNSWSVGMKSSPHNPPLPPRRTTLVNGRANGGLRVPVATPGECKACLRPQALRRPPTLVPNGQTADGVFRPL